MKKKIKELIETAKNKFPVSINYVGQLSEDELEELERFCDIKCPAVYMNGKTTYVIRYKKHADKE